MNTEKINEKINEKTIKTIKSGRPTFYHNNDPENEIRAGGLLLYRFNKGMSEPEFLMIKNRDKYEDFGGKTDIIDKCIEDTILRETDEESNGVLKKKKMTNLVKKNKPVYYKKSKYMVYIIKTKRKYLSKDFGDKEFHDDIPRTVHWIKYSKLIDNKFVKNKLHIRLKFKNFFTRIKSINSIIKDE